MTAKLVGNCVLCENRAALSCSLCGSLVCSKHYDYEKSVCVSCKRGKVI